MMSTSDGPALLIVDDDVDTCNNLTDIFQDMGYHVTVAHDGFSALNLAKDRTFDVALLDLKMPGMDGLTLYREMKKVSSGTVAIIVTAYASHGTQEEALAAGAWKVLAKPVDLARLHQFVNEALDQPLVLVVDDDHDLCANLWDLLRDCNYRVCLAHNETEARKHLSNRTFQIVLIDMKLPQGDGSSVFRLVRGSNPRARTVLITGLRSEMQETITEVLHEGADTVCYKPFDVPGLLETVRRLSERPAAVSDGGAAGGRSAPTS